MASLIFIDHTGAKFKFLYKCGKCFVVCLVQLLFQLSQQVFSRIRLMFYFSNFYFCMYHACIGIFDRMRRKNDLTLVNHVTFGSTVFKIYSKSLNSGLSGASLFQHGSIISLYTFEGHFSGCGSRWPSSKNLTQFL